MKISSFLSEFVVDDFRKAWRIKRTVRGFFRVPDKSRGEKGLAGAAALPSWAKLTDAKANAATPANRKRTAAFSILT